FTDQDAKDRPEAAEDLGTDSAYIEEEPIVIVSDEGSSFHEDVDRESNGVPTVLYFDAITNDNYEQHEIPTSGESIVIASDERGDCDRNPIQGTDKMGSQQRTNEGNIEGVDSERI
ncbi:hypothetical protein HK405_006740, partial [Cladochytrium tenue]